MGKTKLFITGMGGLAGRALVKYAMDENYLVGGTFHGSFPQEFKVLTNKDLLKCYLIDLRKLHETRRAIEDFQPDVVIHLAGKALGGADQQIFNPQVYTENITIFQNMLTAVKELTNKPRLIISTGCLVYDRLTSPDFITETYVENLPNIDPGKQPYRASKLDQEKLLEREKGIDYIITRPTQFTGPGKIPNVLEWYIANAISKIIKSMTNKIKVRNKIAEVDMLDVRDVARAYLILIKRGARGKVYHISSGLPITIENLAKVFLEVAGLNPDQFPVVSTDIEQNVYFRFSPVKLNKLGWYPQFSLKEALASYWKYFKNQEKDKNCK